MRITAALFVLLLTGCASGPGVTTDPHTYLRGYPLGTVSDEQLIQEHGVPDKTATAGVKTYLSFVSGEGWGKREFVYVVEDGVVTNVRYADQGPYGGIDAKTLQSEKQ